MLGWVRTIVEFGTGRPGYPQDLAVEQWLEERFAEFGLAEVRREPVPVNRWRRSGTSLAVPFEPAVPVVFPIPFTAWTSPDGVEAPMVLLGEGTAEDFSSVEVRGRILVVEARFGELTGAMLKQGAWFVRDGSRSIRDGPLQVANWLIRNFPAFYGALGRGACGFVGLWIDSAISGPLYLFDPHDTLDKVRAAELVPVMRFFADTIRRLDGLPAGELAEGRQRLRGSPPARLPAWFRPG